MTSEQDLRLRLWKSERREELETDTTALLDALQDLDGEPDVLLGDILDAMKLLPPGASPLDTIVLRNEKVEQLIQSEVKWVLEKEESYGRYLNYEPRDGMPYTGPAPEDGLMERGAA